MDNPIILALISRVEELEKELKTLGDVLLVQQNQLTFLLREAVLNREWGINN